MSALVHEQVNVFDQLAVKCQVVHPEVVPLGRAQVADQPVPRLPGDGAHAGGPRHLRPARAWRARPAGDGGRPRAGVLRRPRARAAAACGHAGRHCQPPARRHTRRRLRRGWSALRRERCKYISLQLLAIHRPSVTDGL